MRSADSNGGKSQYGTLCSKHEPFRSGLLKNKSIPALKHSFFVDSWQSALNATTRTMSHETKSAPFRKICEEHSLGSLHETFRFSSRKRILLHASIPSHKGISSRVSAIGVYSAWNIDAHPELTMIEQGHAEVSRFTRLPFCVNKISSSSCPDSSKYTPAIASMPLDVAITLSWYCCNCLISNCCATELSVNKNIKSLSGEGRVWYRG